MRRSAETRKDLPITLFPPRPFIPDDVHNLAINFILPHIGIFPIYQYVSSPLDPNHISKARFEFDENGLLIGESARIEAVAFGFEDACNGLSICKGSGRCGGLFGGRDDVAFWFAHFGKCVRA